MALFSRLKYFYICDKFTCAIILPYTYSLLCYQLSYIITEMSHRISLWITCFLIVRFMRPIIHMLWIHTCSVIPDDPASNIQILIRYCNNETMCHFAYISGGHTRQTSSTNGLIAEQSNCLLRHAQHGQYDVIKWKFCCVTGPLCGKVASHRWIPCTKVQSCGLWCFFDVKQKVKWLVIWDYMTFMWRDRNGAFGMHNEKCHIFNSFKYWANVRTLDVGKMAVSTLSFPTMIAWPIIIPAKYLLNTVWRHRRHHKSLAPTTHTCPDPDNADQSYSCSWCSITFSFLNIPTHNLLVTLFLR